MEIKKTLQTSQEATSKLLATMLETQRVQQDSTSTILHRLHLLEKSIPIQRPDFSYSPRLSTAIQHQLSSSPSGSVNNPRQLNIRNKQPNIICL